MQLDIKILLVIQNINPSKQLNIIDNLIGHFTIKLQRNIIV